MVLAYKLFVLIYRMAVGIVALFNEKAQKAIVQRKTSLLALQQQLEGNQENIVWFHAASLGEFEQGLPIMQAYKNAYPNRKILVTFFSPSGYEQRKSHPIADFTAYLPWDEAARAQQFVDLVNPSEVFFIKYEFWYFILREVSQRNIPLYCISARFVENQIYFQWYGGLHRKILSFFNHIFVQEKGSISLLNASGLTNCSISGDTRFDNVAEKAKSPNKIDKIEAFKGDHDLFILGSVWTEDMELLKDFLRELPKNLKVLVAPHDISEGGINRISKHIKEPFALFTTYEDSQESILILNTIGHLFNAFQYGDFAYIGGAFGGGLHNILEPAVFGLPVVFGDKNLDKFPEAIELSKLEGAFKVSNALQTKDILSKLSTNIEFRAKSSDVCKLYMEENKGATDVIISYLKAKHEG